MVCSVAERQKLTMKSTVAYAAIFVVFAFSAESVRGIKCYQCVGQECEGDLSNKKQDCLVQTCFHGSGIINGTKVYGRTCGAGVGPTCPTATCQVAPTLVKQLKDLKNCTGKCCDTDLCNDTPFSTVAPPTTVPTNQTTSSNHSTPGDQDQLTTAKTPGDGAASYKANIFLFITVMAGMALL